MMLFGGRERKLDSSVCTKRREVNHPKNGAVKLYNCPMLSGSLAFWFLGPVVVKLAGDGREKGYCRYSGTVIELQDKYLAYVNERFQNHTLFHKVLIRRWHFRKLLRCSVTRVLLEVQLQNYFASICDNILKEGNSGKLSDEAIEETLEKKVQHELLSVYANQLLEKEHLGCHALLRDDKHVTTEGMALVKLAEDEVSNKKVWVCISVEASLADLTDFLCAALMAKAADALMATEDKVDTVAYHLSVLKDMYPNGINLLSLFFGIGGAEVALYRLGIPIKNVVSVEKS
ncbi:hypothetical protein K1719_030080 [Acacia pycnantha]|nr:hypothetical protein K1719_030080 [Acacia pycnantha]